MGSVARPHRAEAQQRVAHPIAEVRFQTNVRLGRRAPGRSVRALLRDRPHRHARASPLRAALRLHTPQVEVYLVVAEASLEAIQDSRAGTPVEAAGTAAVAGTGVEVADTGVAADGKPDRLSLISRRPVSYFLVSTPGRGTS